MSGIIKTESNKEHSFEHTKLQRKENIMRTTRKLVAIGLVGAMALSLAACGTTITSISVNRIPETIEKNSTVHIDPEYGYKGFTPDPAKAEEIIGELGLTYQSSDPSIATVDENGNITGISKGVAEISVVSADGKLTAEKKIQVVVTPTGIDMPDSFTLAMDSPEANIEAKVIPEDAENAFIAFKSSDESIVTVNGNGTLMAVSAGNAMLLATVEGTDITKECEVTVLPSAEEISLSETTLTLNADESSQLAFTVLPENACTDYKSWFSSDESIATVDEDGTVTGHKAGTCDISLAISDKTATCKVTVKAAKAKNNTVSASGQSTSASSNSNDTTAASAPSPQASADTSQPVAQASEEASAPASEASASGGSSAAPAPGAGHGQWTIYSDGYCLDLINGVRASAGLGALSWDSGLGDVAVERSKQILADFSHNGAVTTECLAMGTTDAGSTVSAWQGSSAHYAAMTGPYTVGATAHIYDGDGCHYWVAVFR